MASREVDVIEVREVLRCWLVGYGPRTAAERAGVDRRNVPQLRECRPGIGAHVRRWQSIRSPMR